MKTLMAKMLSVGIVMAAAIALHAQTKILTVDVPFQFYLGRTAMPAGAYTVSESATGAIVTLKTANSIASLVTVNTVAKNGEINPRLVFHRSGDSYFLSQIWGASSVGHSLSQSAREKEASASAALPEVTLPILAQ